MAPKVERSDRGRSMVGASGAPPPLHVVDRDGYPEMVQPVPGQPGNVTSVSQLSVRDKNGQPQFVPLFPEMNADAIRRKLDRIAGPLTHISLHCDEEHWSYYVSLLNELWPGSRIEEGRSLERGVHKMKVSTRFQVTSAFFRGIAKTALHYYLVNSCRGYSGHEDRFSAIRQFIRHGGEPGPFFPKEPPGARLVMPHIPTGGGFYPANWQHWLILDEVSDVASVMIALFVGPGHMPVPYHVTLGPIDDEVVAIGAYRGHVYAYSDKPHAEPGFVEPAPLSRLRPP